MCRNHLYTLYTFYTNIVPTFESTLAKQPDKYAHVMITDLSCFSMIRFTQILQCYFTGAGAFTQVPHWQGLYLLSDKPSYWQISWSLEAARLGVTLSHHSRIWMASWQRCCRGACQISERLESVNSNLVASRFQEILRSAILLLSE